MAEVISFARSDALAAWAPSLAACSTNGIVLMAGLKSNMFSRNDRLNKCLVQDSAHVTPGSHGEHVALIQIAVLLLAGGQISGSEIQGQTYGKTTAVAVLDYKARRGIINRAYQARPDEIVGRMTIAAMDIEMQGVEMAERFKQVRSTQNNS